MTEPETYKACLRYWPYRASLDRVLHHVVEHAPRTATLIDVMCGPGYLLGRIRSERSDLTLIGVDIDDRYVRYGRETYADISFEKGDVLTWQPRVKGDVVVCTGALHHVAYDKQDAAVANISRLIARGGFAMISDCYVDDYLDENERQLAAAKLGCEYLVETIANGAPTDVISETINILRNDVLMREYKVSIRKRMRILRKSFRCISTLKTWPSPSEGFDVESGYGDYIHVCSN